MKQQHHPTDKKSFEKGINSDANKELLGVRQGEHVDARNMRSVSMDGDNFAKKKIKGEEVLYPNIDNRCTIGTGLPLSDDYECMMTQEINGHIVEAWAVDPATSALPSLMRIDGKIVLMSVNFPIRLDFPLEYHKNETCIGGEFYITDDNSRPMVFNAKDLLLNSGVSVGNETGACSEKYFNEFNISENIVGVSSSLFKIAFIKQSGLGGSFDEVFGSNGLLVGMYSYSYRYATTEGDRSGWSPVSEMIPVIRGANNYSAEYPKMGNYSSDPSLTSPTTHGNHLKIKYDNTNSFDFIEVRRDGWYAGSTLNTPPISDIIGAFSVSPGLNTVDVLDYSTPDEAEDPLTEEDLVDVAESIQAAKAIRYYNSKLWLMNVKYREKDIEDVIDFVDIDPDDRIAPTIQKIGKKGHVDTFNAAYFKSNMRGEANGFGLFLYDDAGAKSYAKSIVDSFQFPNRRDPVSTETLGNSYFGVVKAADTNGAAPSNTHEVFDHATAKKRDVVPGEVEKQKISVPPFGTFQNPPTTGTWAHPTLVNILDNQVLGTATDPYKPLHPVSQTDPVSDLNRRVNTHVYTDNGYSSPATPYNSECFGIDYYSMGAAFSGINPETLPDWADGFSVVQTNPAKRVIAQGLGFYSLISCETGALNGFGANGGKESHALLCNFPDLDQQTGLTPEVVTGLLGTHGASSPYRLQVVSPLGFFTEFYSYFANSFSAKRKAIDAIAYVRILEDRGQINPLWDGKVSLNDYVGFGSWRSLSENASMFPSNTNPNLFTIDTITEAPTANASAVNLHITLVEGIYSMVYTGSAAEDGDFYATTMKKWLEPMYVVNLVRDDAQINPGLLSEFNYTGHYIKLRSKIIESDGSVTQTAALVSERWEDCTRDFVGQVNNAYSNLERFTFVGVPGGVENRWLDVTGKTPAVVGVLQANIASFGFDTVTDASGSYNVYGVYTVTQTYDGSSPVFTLSFDNLPIGVDVYVNYDNRIPVRVFGGDTYVNDHIFPVLDNTYTSSGNPQDDSHDFSFNVPFPYPMYSLNVFIGLVGNVTAGFTNSRYLTNTLTAAGGGYYGGNVLEGHIYFDSSFLGSGASGFKPSKWRQLVAMWTAETRINLSFAFNVEITKTEEDSQFFPLKHYVYRPGKWDDGADPDSIPPSGTFLDDNNIYDGYYTDYGREWDNWGHGGFRFRQAVNIDYSKGQTGELVTTIPALGFDEEVDFCTRILWSVTRPINVQDTPTVKTFPPANFYDISDNTGEIKFAWDADSAKGNNLYALTNNGVCLVLVDKRILSEINSNELATMGTDIGGVTDELWINKEIGMDNETWRSWAEYANVLFWTNSTASYMMGNNTIENIAENGYSHMLRTKYIPKANKGVDSKVSGVYDVLHKEYYVTADEREKNEYSTLIYGVSQEALQCQSNYRYDKYLSINNKVYGMKGMETFELGVGNLLNGDEYECYVAGVSNADSYSDKEFIRIRVNSHSKPKRVEFYSDYDAYLAGTPSSIVDATVNPLNIKDYHGYECYIPRKSVAPFDREQGRLVIFKIVSDDDEEFFVSTAGIQYKTLK
jgi:hypothetical protein